MNRTLVAGSVLALAAGLAGCRGDDGVTAGAAIATDACTLLQDEVIDRGPEAPMSGALLSAVGELEERAREAGISDTEMEEAMREQCPGILDDLESLFGS